MARRIIETCDREGCSETKKPNQEWLSVDLKQDALCIYRSIRLLEIPDARHFCCNRCLVAEMPRLLGKMKAEEVQAA